MTDKHLHIGQFFESYYQPLDVLRAASEAGVSGGIYTSATTCRTDARYADIEREIDAVCTVYPADIWQPYFWYIPAYIDKGITAEKAFAALPYKGIKLHPRAHRWNLHDGKHTATLHTLFDFAAAHSLSVLIHTGEDEYERPAFFARYIAAYPAVQFTLAHGRPAKETITMLSQYSNAYCDSAFMDTERLAAITGAGFARRILTGSDFPATHYFAQKRKNISLEAQYKKDYHALMRVEKYKSGELK